MSIEAGRFQLEGAYRDLRAQWESAHSLWQDEKAAEFEQRFLTPLKPDVTLALEALRDLGKLTARAREEVQ